MGKIYKKVNQTLLGYLQKVLVTCVSITQPPVQWVPSLSRGQGGRGLVLTTHPHLVPRYTERSRAIPLLSPKRPSRPIRNLKPSHCLYK